MKEQAVSHRVGIHMVAIAPLMPGYVQASCDECGWEGTLYKRDRAQEAQREAIEHQGGTLRVREFRRPGKPVQSEEMFPGVR